jgi:hypothetical protein
MKVTNMGKQKLRRNPGGHRGPLPTEPRIWWEPVLEKRPSDQWQADHQSEINAGTQPEPTDEDMVIGINIYGHMAFPSRTLPPKLWKQGKMLLGTLHEVDCVEFRAGVEADIALQQQGPDDDHRAELARVGEMARMARKAAKKD